MNRTSSARCKLCVKELSISGGQISGLITSSGDTTYSECVVPPGDKQPKLVPRYRPISTNRAHKINKMISKYIDENMLPILTVESMAFLELTVFLEPQYKASCRLTMTGILQNMQNDLKAKVKTDMTTNKLDKFTLTTDIWTSLTNMSYLSVTASYVADDLKLKRQLSQWRKDTLQIT